ncbi:hypothetical protein BC831DRAFT_503828 [Entophlyctis helioformis]|nr:hypothetical protein BC831DRAFT_503828 [Entophlyctis helioformis]
MRPQKRASNFAFPIDRTGHNRLLMGNEQSVNKFVGKAKQKKEKQITVRDVVIDPKWVPADLGFLSLERLVLINLSLPYVPDIIFQLQTLDHLTISGSDIASVAGIGNLNRLKSLVLHSNRLEWLPDDFALLWELEELDIHDNRISNRGIPPELFTFPNLRSLDVSKNRLSQMPRDFAQFCFRIKDLRLHGNPWSASTKQLQSLADSSSCQETRNALVSIFPDLDALEAASASAPQPVASMQKQNVSTEQLAEITSPRIGSKSPAAIRVMIGSTPSDAPDDMRRLPTSTTTKRPTGGIFARKNSASPIAQDLPSATDQSAEAQSASTEMADKRKETKRVQQDKKTAKSPKGKSPTVDSAPHVDLGTVERSAGPLVAPARAAGPRGRKPPSKDFIKTQADAAEQESLAAQAKAAAASTDSQSSASNSASSDRPPVLLPPTRNLGSAAMSPSASATLAASTAPSSAKVEAEMPAGSPSVASKDKQTKAGQLATELARKLPLGHGRSSSEVNMKTCHATPRPQLRAKSIEVLSAADDEPQPDRQQQQLDAPVPALPKKPSKQSAAPSAAGPQPAAPTEQLHMTIVLPSDEPPPAPPKLSTKPGRAPGPAPGPSADAAAEASSIPAALAAQAPHLMPKTRARSGSSPSPRDSHLIPKPAVVTTTARTSTASNTGSDADSSPSRTHGKETSYISVDKKIMSPHQEHLPPAPKLPGSGSGRNSDAGEQPAQLPTPAAPVLASSGAPPTAPKTSGLIGRKTSFVRTLPAEPAPSLQPSNAPFGAPANAVSTHAVPAKIPPWKAKNGASGPSGGDATGPDNELAAKMNARLQASRSSADSTDQDTPAAVSAKSTVSLASGGETAPSKRFGMVPEKNKSNDALGQDGNAVASTPPRVAPKLRGPSADTQNGQQQQQPQQDDQSAEQAPSLSQASQARMALLAKFSQDELRDGSSVSSTAKPVQQPPAVQQKPGQSVLSARSIENLSGVQPVDVPQRSPAYMATVSQAQTLGGAAAGGGGGGGGGGTPGVPPKPMPKPRTMTSQKPDTDAEQPTNQQPTPPWKRSVQS